MWRSIGDVLLSTRGAPLVDQLGRLSGNHVFGGEPAGELEG